MDTNGSGGFLILALMVCAAILSGVGAVIWLLWYFL
jgi:hypothetical protein